MIIFIFMLSTFFQIVNPYINLLSLMDQSRRSVLCLKTYNLTLEGKVATLTLWMVWKIVYYKMLVSRYRLACSALHILCIHYLGGLGLPLVLEAPGPQAVPSGLGPQESRALHDPLWPQPRPSGLAPQLSPFPQAGSTP